MSKLSKAVEMPDRSEGRLMNTLISTHIAKSCCDVTNRGDDERKKIIGLFEMVSERTEGTIV